MRSLMLVTFVIMVLLPLSASGGQEAATVSFDADPVGQPPDGWSTAMTHSGGAPRWEVVRDPTAPSGSNVLAQLSADATRGRFPLAIYERDTYEDGEVSMRFKPISGRVDQAGGIVWRYRDENNYYVVRANALEDNVVLYVVEGGRRSSLAPKGTPPQTYGVDAEVPGGEWNTLRVTFEGPLFTVYLNGEELFEVEDATFTEAGKVGLWTKADSVTHFDEFEPRVFTPSP